MSKTSLIPIEKIEKVIYLIRGEKVMLDRDLASLYDVETKVLNRAVKRNLKRFPLDFMFQLTAEEAENLRCQFGTSSLSHGGRRYLPYVFTEQGVAMLSTVLNSERAISVNIEIMRAFVKLRRCSRPTSNSLVDWTSWKASTISSSKLSSTRFDN